MSYASSAFNKCKRDGTYSTIRYESSVRVSSEPTKQNLVCLGPDRVGACFCRGPTSAAQNTAWGNMLLNLRDNPGQQYSYNDPFGGDFGFFNNQDIMLRLTDNRLNDWIKATNAGSSVQNNMFFEPDANVSQYNPWLTNVVFNDSEIVFGPSKHVLIIKSATIGAVVTFKLYKCRARYDIPRTFSVNRLATEVVDLDIEAKNTTNIEQLSAQDTAQGVVNNYIALFQHDVNTFMGLQMLKNNDWFEIDQRDSTSLTRAGSYWYSSTYPALCGAMETLKMPGAGLSNVPGLLDLFEIVDIRTGTLNPGQEVSYKMAGSAQVFNPAEFQFKRDSFTKKGEIVFFLKIYGSHGHEKFTSAISGNQNFENIYNGQSGVLENGGAHFNQKQSRPLMSNMAAYVDVKCIKTLPVGFRKKEKKRHVVKRIQADDMAWNLNVNGGSSIVANPTQSSIANSVTRTFPNTTLLADAFPSFYGSSEAYVDKNT